MYRHKITPEGEQVVAGDDVATTYVKDALDANFDYSNGHTNFGPPDEGSSEGDSDSSREVDMRAVIGKRMFNPKRFFHDTVTFNDECKLHACTMCV